MRIINPTFEVLGKVDPLEILRTLELCGRVCYKSEGLINANSAEPFIKQLIKSGHESVIEHEKITVKIICDRGITHELVRHRIASYSQESTRYCNYSLDKFDNELTFIRPFFWDESSDEYAIWKRQMESVEKCYISLIEAGAKPEQARSILPNSLKSEIVVTMNLREWRHFFKLRTSSRAHPQMREISVAIFNEFKKMLPIVFEDIKVQ